MCIGVADMVLHGSARLPNGVYWVSTPPTMRVTLLSSLSPHCQLPHRPPPLPVVQDGSAVEDPYADENVAVAYLYVAWPIHPHATLARLSPDGVTHGGLCSSHDLDTWGYSAASCSHPSESPVPSQSHSHYLSMTGPVPRMR